MKTALHSWYHHIRACELFLSNPKTQQTLLSIPEKKKTICLICVHAKVAIKCTSNSLTKIKRKKQKNYYGTDMQLVT